MADPVTRASGGSSKCGDFNMQTFQDIQRKRLEQLSRNVGNLGASAAPARGQATHSGQDAAAAGLALDKPAAGLRAGNGEAVTAEQAAKIRKLLRAKLGEDVFTSWFNALEFDAYEGKRLQVSVPVKFLRNWIQSHYVDTVLECCRSEFPDAESVAVVVRSMGKPVARASANPEAPARNAADKAPETPASGAMAAARSMPGEQRNAALPGALANSLSHAPSRTNVHGFEGSPLDPRYTFDSFVVGPSNHVAHAAACNVAEALMGNSPGYNPLFLHAAVGMGKTHLLHAIAWDVKRRRPEAQVLYLTAEGFRYRFVEALRGSDPLAFKEKFRQVDVLLIDDLEFMHGEKTEQEFDHIINALLDGRRQVVVASARPPAQIEHMKERMRSRLQRGLVTKIDSFDDDLRLKVLEKRLAEKQAADPTFQLQPDILRLLANRLTENGRELEGAITRLFANWQYMRAPITIDIAETVIRDLVQGLEPRRIKIDDILRIVSRHYGVSKTDILSPRRQRSVVWPRQIGMYLSKQMTQRSLPEIGRRFGNRDHTTVLHAIRKIEKELSGNESLREELEDLKKLISH